jgi:hypothetical protein
VTPQRPWWALERTLLPGGWSCSVRSMICLPPEHAQHPPAPPSACARAAKGQSSYACTSAASTCTERLRLCFSCLEAAGIFLPASMARTLLRLPVLLAQEALEVVPVLLGMCEHRALGTHEGSDLRPSLGAAQIIPVLERPRLLVQCVELRASAAWSSARVRTCA